MTRRLAVWCVLSPLALGVMAAARWQESKPVPATLHWRDRRIIGTMYLASSPQGDRTVPAGFPNNPRRYFNDPNSSDFDLRDPAGTMRFEQRMLRQAQDTAANLRRLDAQGVITWDIEGEQYPQSTSYVCAPDQVAALAPEMEAVVSAGPYAGLKLDDAYFKILRDAGFRVGVCVRPQHFTLRPDGHADQVTLPNGEVAAELIRKMRYAHTRWGATLFYLDSTVEVDGRTLPAEVIEAAAAALPDSLLIPEESTTRMYASTAPFQTFLFHGDTGTPAAARGLYPQGFSANLVNDVSPDALREHRGALTDAVRGGDVLMVHAGYWQANNDAVMDIYREAGRRP